METKDRFEELCDQALHDYYSFDIDDMLQKQSLTEVVKFLVGDADKYANTLEAKIVELTLYNRLRAEHSGRIVIF